MPVIATIDTLPRFLQTNQHLLITPTGQLLTDNEAIMNDFTEPDLIGMTNITITILGVVSSNLSNAINLYYASITSGPTDQIMIGATGVVTAAGAYATIGMGGAGNVFSNAGTVLGGAGLWGNHFTGGRIENSGSITGINYAGVHLEFASSTTVTNTGFIQGVAGVELVASTAHVFNAGHILSTDETRAAVDAAQATAGFVLRNTGDISGPVKGILGSAFANVITSSGTVEGTIDLGSGADKFFGRLGTVDSKISGGNDNDFIQSGRGDDVVDGGSGIDTLAGNLGDDSLTGGSSADIFVFQRRGGDDVVTDFTHGSDKLDLRAFHLVNFAAVSSAMHAHVGGVEIDLSPYAGGTVELVGLTLAQVTLGDFLM